jgi:hypothetical protein
MFKYHEVHDAFVSRGGFKTLHPSEISKRNSEYREGKMSMFFTAHLDMPDDVG